jgi:hypothetical protein
MPSPPNNYVRVDNSIGSNAKMLDIDDAAYLEAVGLYVLVLGYCDRANTDGAIKRKAVTSMRGIAPGRDDLLDELIRVGLIAADNGDLSVPDYLDWQRSKEDKEERSRRASMAAAIGNAGRTARRGASSDAKRGAFRTQRDRERYKGLSACEKCEGQGWLWITSDRAGSCPECKGAGEKRAES